MTQATQTLVTCVGLAVQDLVFTMDAPVLAGEKNFAAGLHPVGGGPAANAAVSIARLGGQSRLVSALGTDTIGDAITAELVDFGVDCSLVRRVDAPSPLSAVLIGPDGDRTIVNRTDPALWDLASLPTGSDIDGSDVVLTDVRWLPGALAAASVARDLNIPTVVDWDLTDEPVPDELLDMATHVIFSEPAFEQRFRSVSSSTVTDVARRHDTVVGVTQGSSGVVWASDGKGHRTDAFGIEAVDTLGAGDVFHGAFALGVTRGLAMSDIVEWSAAAAAVKCATGGGRDGFPSEADVAALLEE